MYTLSPMARRILYVTTFEALAIVLSTWLLSLLSNDPSHSNLPVAITVSTIAVVWNYVYNTLFEAAERRYKVSNRTVKVRVLHSLGFEGGLVLFCVPLFMIWYQVSMWQAVQMEAAILIFFLVYTYVFTWIFDQIFTIPNSATKH